MIEIKSNSDSFDVFYKGKKVLSHSTEAPCVTLGRGKAKYKQKLSNYKIKNKVSDIIVLNEFLIKETKKKTTVSFEGNLSMILEEKQNRLLISFQCSDETINRFYLRLNGDEKEHLYGCGEQYSELDMKGLKVPIWIEEQGVGRGKDLITLLANIHSGAGGNWATTYFAVPTFISSKNYFCHIDTTYYSLLDFSEPDFHTLEVWEVPASIIIDVAETAVDTLQSLSGYFGKQHLLPDWTFEGMWLGVQGGTEIVQQKLKDALDAGIKVGAVWAQDWEGIRMTSFGKQLMWNWKYDKELYEGLPKYIKDLKKQGIRFLGYINPMLAQEGDLYKEAVKNDYLVKNKDGEVYHITITTFPVGLVDLTNPKAVKWYKKVIKDEMIKLGLSGWMADFAEAMPTDGVVFSGDSGEKVHNDYAALWAKTNYEALEESKKLGEICFFMRAGFTGSQKYATAMWAGDQLVNWSFDDGLATVIPAGISLGMSGLGNYHSDIGGYTTVGWIKRKKELLLRWCEHSVFTPIMRTHEGNRPDDNWQFNSDQETLDFFGRMTGIYVHLKDYHKYLCREYSASGIPPMRHPYLHYEDDEILHSLKYQYMYGRDLMVAPVIQPGKKKVKVYLPKDRWVHAWTGTVYTGGWIKVDAPLGQPPVFYRPESKYINIFEKMRFM